MKILAQDALNDQTHMIQTEVLTETSPDYWIFHINESAAEVGAAIIKTGQILNAAKAALGHGNFSKLFESGRLRIDQRTAEMFMRIANNEALANSHNYSILPSSLNALHILSKVDPAQLQRAIDDGKIFPAMTINAARLFVSKFAPKKDTPSSLSTRCDAKPQHETDFHEPDLYVRMIDIIEEARRRCPKEAIFQLMRRLADYVQNIYPDEDNLPNDEFN